MPSILVGIRVKPNEVNSLRRSPPSKLPTILPTASPTPTTKPLLETGKQLVVDDDDDDDGGSNKNNDNISLSTRINQAKPADSAISSDGDSSFTVNGASSFDYPNMDMITGSNQIEAYEFLMGDEILESLEGNYNVTILAYGQTGKF